VEGYVPKEAHSCIAKVGKKGKGGPAGGLWGPPEGGAGEGVGEKKEGRGLTGEWRSGQRGEGTSKRFGAGG